RFACRYRVRCGPPDYRPVPYTPLFRSRVAVGAVGVGVRLGADVARVGAGVAVAPVDDVAADRVGARVGDRAQGEAVGRALVDVSSAAHPSELGSGADLAGGLLLAKATV